ncbi:MAG: ATP-binding protein [Erythrobacter sp.]|uniref:sensor histidine kinase n=1 Tax=Erythrobacter sp. TaxID=1042 RepID=UPI003297F91C
MALLERAHASAGMGHFVLDPKRMTIEFSSWVRNNIGLNDMPIPLSRLPEIVVEEERAEFNRKVTELIELKEDFSFETVVMTAAGKERTQRISGITAFENEHTREGLIGYFGILQEITHEKRSKAELRAARDAAQAELDARANLLAVVSHEIRTPLGGILGIIDQLKRERSALERDRALTLIEDSSEVLLDTLDAILQRARIGEDSSNLDSKKFRPLSVAHRVAELFRPLARRKGLRIEVSGPTDTHANGDPARLQQVIANIVSNGVKFTQSGSVAINVSEPANGDAYWRFKVSDTGAGMDQSRLTSIFHPFGQSSADSLGRDVGVGLGLSITSDLVEAMGGTIEVESELGEGSSFSFAIPFEPVENESTDQAAAPHGGVAAIALERASDKVQVEAIASQYGYDLIEVSDEDLLTFRAAEPVVLILDREKFTALPRGPLDQFRRVVIIDSGVEAKSAGVSFPETIEPSVNVVPNSQIARALGEILSESIDDTP